VPRTKWIVGAGSAGCILANRLSQAGNRVLLLEAGNSDKGFWLHLPIGYFKTIFDGVKVKIL
jgi:choline dehydrogenase